MNLGQSMFALFALALISTLALNTDRTILNENDRMSGSQFGVTAISLAQSVAEEAMGKYFDANPETAIPGAISGLANLTSVSSLGAGITEKYRDGLNNFNDFDDYNNIFLVYKSASLSDTAKTPGSDWETTVPGLNAKYFIKARVQYIDISKLGDTNEANDTSATPTWHKRLTVTVINPTAKDTLRYPVIMSYWN